MTDLTTRLKELLAAASGDHDDSSCYCYNEGWGKNRCRVGPAEKRLAALAIPLAEELVASQEFVEAMALRLDHVQSVARDLGHRQFDACQWCNSSPELVAEARDALRLEKLEAVKQGDAR
ncbi:hypothetical protein LCGC14_2952530 [marine sediment metagenome]|uniref:Uncharacterized protein n=1 Tax=marine sediment metagenome TaxID=412755 RepID=A0A0F8ZMG4_9ZZZZ